MSYTLSKSPTQIKDLPKHAKEIWIAAYNSAYEQHDGDEGKSAKIAWAAVKNKYKKTDDKWAKKASAAMHGFSLFELTDKIYISVRNTFRNMDGWDYYSIYVEDTSLTEVVISDNFGRRLSIPYVVSEDGIVLLDLSNMKAVKKTWEDIPEGGFSAAIKFTAAQEDKTGSTWQIICLSAGKSGNNWKLSGAVLKAAVNLFNSIPVFVRADDEHCEDKARSVKNIVGDITGAKYINGKGIVGTLNIHPDAEWLKIKMLSLWAEGKLQGDNALFAYSFVGGGTGKYDESDGYFDIQELTSITSVDVVVQPATETSTLALVAGITNNAQIRRVGMDRLIAFIKKHAPDLHAQIDLKNPKEPQVQELFAQAEKLLEDKPLVAAQVEKDAADKKEKQLTAVKAKTAKKSDDGSDGGNDDLRRTVQEMQCEKLLDKHLAAAGQLPEPIKNVIRKQFADQVFDEVSLTGAITNHLDALAVMSSSGDIQGHGATHIEVGLSGAKKVVAALDGFFAQEDIDGVRYSRSFRDLYVEITGDTLLSGQSQNPENFRRLTAALNTGSWAQILGDSITRQMQKEYAMPGLQDWRKIVSDITAPKDFRTNRRMQMGGYGNLPNVAQGADYLAMESPSDRESTYAISKRGGLETLTMEMVANDDVGAVRRIPVKLARAAANTLYRLVLNVIQDNTLTVDGIVIFHGDHSNLGAAALDATSLLAAKKAMMQQLAYGSATEYLGTLPRWLLIPTDLEDTAFRLTRSLTLIGPSATEGSQNATEPSIHSTYGLKPLLVPYWLDTNNWALVCDPKDVPTLEVGFFNGQEEPELFVQDMPTVGSMFNADKITYKIRHIYGVCVLDYRGMYKAVV